MATNRRRMLRVQARSCKVHKAVYDAAVTRLQSHGAFSRKEVLADTDYEGVADSVRWDYIVEFICADYGIEMVSLSDNYFKRHRRLEEQVNPAKYLALGHGKKTAGYGIVTMAHAHLVIKQLSHRQKVVDGAADALEEQRAHARKKIGRDDLDDLEGPVPAIPPTPPTDLSPGMAAAPAGAEED